MPEISIGGGDDDSGDSGGGGGMPDMDSMMDQMESMLDRVKENPELADMLGIDLPEINMEDAPTDEDGQPTVDAEFFGGVCRDLEQQGFGDTTVAELAEFIENNTEQVDAMIGRHMD